MTIAFDPREPGMRAGRVLLVGAGPGDPELVTLRAVRALHEADVVIYDRLANPALLAHCRPDCLRRYVGKQAGCHAATQDEINALLLAHARTGVNVVRLKGGDPFIFGRGGEEMQFLQASGIAVDVVPGITAALGCAASAGVPLTHRGVANGVRFVTAHAKDDGGWRDLGGLPWSPEETLVIYMGLGGVAVLRDGLRAAGAPDGLPVMAVANGTTPRERRVTCTLADMADVIPAAGLSSPCLLVVGEVVRSAGRLTPDLGLNLDIALAAADKGHAVLNRHLQ